MTYKNHKMPRRNRKGLNKDSMFKNRKIYTSILRSHFFLISFIFITIPSPYPKPSMAAHHCDPNTQMKDSAAWGVQDQPELCMSSYKARSRLSWATCYPSSKTKTNKFLIFNLKSIWKKKLTWNIQRNTEEEETKRLACADSRLTTKLQLARPCGTDERTET